MTLQVSVVIPARNDGAGLPHAVASVLAQDAVDVVEIFLCIGPSEDDCEAVAAMLAEQHQTVHVVPNPTGGISAGLNLGLTAATTKVLVRVDARCRLPQGYIAQAHQSMMETGAANIGAVQVPIGHSPMQRAIASAMVHPLGSGGAAYRRGRKRQQVATAFLGVYSIAALRAVGGWDERFARNEDAELNHRLAAADHTVWLEPELRVEYEPRSTLPSLLRQYFDYGWWRRRMVARHRAIQMRQQAAPALVLGLLVALGLGVFVSWWFLAVPVAYVCAVVIAALLASTASSPRSLGHRLRVAIALIAMHLAWGTGFLLSGLRRINKE